MRIYISGPMSGIAQFNFPAFNQAADLLTVAGHVPVNPADGGVVPGKSWEAYLREDLRLILDSDAVATLPGWRASRGASLEVYVAERLRMPVRPVWEWTAYCHRVPRAESLVRLPVGGAS